MMKKPLLSELEDFLAVFPISGYRLGVIVAKNGRLLDRLRAGGRLWPDTEERIRAALSAELDRRKAKQ